MDDHADFGQFLRVGVFLIGVVKGSYALRLRFRTSLGVNDRGTHQICTRLSKTRKNSLKVGLFIKRVEALLFNHTEKLFHATQGAPYIPLLFSIDC